MSTRDLIDALIAGDSVAIDSTFDVVMNQKISASLDDLRTSVAQNMFNSQVEEIQDTTETVETPTQDEIVNSEEV